MNRIERLERVVSVLVKRVLGEEIAFADIAQQADPVAPVPTDVGDRLSEIESSVQQIAQSLIEASAAHASLLETCRLLDDRISSIKVVREAA